MCGGAQLMLRLTLSPKNRKFILHVFLENKSLFIIAIKHQSVNEPSCSTKRLKTNLVENLVKI